MLALLSSYPSTSHIFPNCLSPILPQYIYPFSLKLLSPPFCHKCPHLHPSIFPFLSSFLTNLSPFLPYCSHPPSPTFFSLQTSDTSLSPILSLHSLNINKLLEHTAKYMTNNINLKQTNT